MCSRKRSELKNWMFEQQVNNKGYSSIHFVLREFYFEYKNVILSYFGARIMHFLKYNNSFRYGFFFFFFLSLVLKVTQVAEYITTQVYLSLKTFHYKINNGKIKLNLKVGEICKDCSSNFLWKKWQRNRIMFNFIRDIFITLWIT